MLKSRKTCENNLKIVSIESLLSINSHTNKKKYCHRRVGNYRVNEYIFIRKEYILIHWYGILMLKHFVSSSG